jgi:uncharacterized membrane protein YebE (DUF533 family)
LDTRKLLDQLVGSGLAGGLAGGALAGLIVGNKKTRKLAASAAKLGGLALVAGIAYKAWQQHQQGQTAAAPLAAPPPGSGFLPPETDPVGAESLSLLLVRAIIAAAKADGKIDAAESQKILSHINTLDLPDDDKAFLFEEYARPLDIEALARDVRTREQATEVFAASALMLEPPSPPERIYLQGLADALSLEPSLAQEGQGAAAATRA